MPVEEIEDIEFEKLLQDKRHRELKNALVAISSILSKKDDVGIIEAIEKQSQALAGFVSVIKSISAPEVNVEINPKEFVSSINKLCEDVIASNNKVIETLNTRLLPDTFTLNKGYGGITESVKVNYKESNKITIKK